ncbi:hypothetical protein CAEBREN_01462 [Caenorhabditis brenneri]|uniref:Uncharacterized protein n=1 Tax=Caenorhabditis brenneri TaxID=135651 RepID=G0N284_CAEBE|nr:hypothetical protein CAEBREN_01462 [Caenorhabditis brenneri]
MRVRLFWSLKSKKTLKIFNFLTLSGKLEKIEVNGYHHRVLRLKLHKDKSNMPSQLCSTSWYSPSNLSRYPAGKLFDAPPPFIAVPNYGASIMILSNSMQLKPDSYSSIPTRSNVRAARSYWKWQKKLSGAKLAVSSSSEMLVAVHSSTSVGKKEK